MLNTLKLDMLQQCYCVCNSNAHSHVIIMCVCVKCGKKEAESRKSPREGKLNSSTARCSGLSWSSIHPGLDILVIGLSNWGPITGGHVPKADTLVCDLELEAIPMHRELLCVFVPSSHQFNRFPFGRCSGLTRTKRLRTLPFFLCALISFRKGTYDLYACSHAGSLAPPFPSPLALPITSSLFLNR